MMLRDAEYKKAIQMLNRSVSTLGIEGEKLEITIGEYEKCEDPTHCIILLDNGPNEQEIYEALFTP